MDKSGFEKYALVDQIKLQYRLEQYTDRELANVNSVMNKVQREILHDWDKMTEFSQSRAITLLEQSRAMSAGAKETMTTSIAAMLGKVSEDASATHSKILSFSGKAANVNSVMLGSNQMQAFWQTTPVGGHLLKDWVNKTFDSNTIDKIQKEIAAGLFKGETMAQLGKRFKEGFGMSKTQIKTLTRTYVATANMDALQRTFDANSDLIKEVKWRATGDNRTCLICASLDSMRFPYNDHPAIPAHPLCRCTLIPVPTSLAKMGVQVGDAEAAFKKADPESKAMSKGNIGSSVFNRVGKKMSVKDWILGQPAAEQRKIMGPMRQELLSKGLITFDDLVDLKHLRIRTLAELNGEAVVALSAKMGQPEAMAAMANKKQAAKIKAKIKEEGKLIDRANEAAIKEQLQEKKQALKAADNEKSVAEQQAKKAAELIVKDEPIKARIDALKAEYHAAYNSGAMSATDKALKVDAINSLEMKLSSVKPKLSTVSSMEKEALATDFYKQMAENYKAKYAALEETDLDGKAKYLELAIKAEIKAGPGVIQSTYASLEQYTKEVKAAKYLEELAAKEAADVAAKEAAKKQLAADFKDKDAVAVFKSDTDLPDGMFKEVPSPDLTAPEIWGPEVKAVEGKGISSGAIVFDKDTGKVFIYEPTEHFGDYEHTFPKGQLEPHLSIQQNAVKEVWEEIGMQVKLVDHLGDYEKTTSVSSYYVGVAEKGNPAAFGWETQAVKVVPKEQLLDFLNMKVDKNIGADFINAFAKADFLGDGDAVAGFKKMNAEKKAIHEAEKAAIEAANKLNQAKEAMKTSETSLANLYQEEKANNTILAGSKIKKGKAKTDELKAEVDKVIARAELKKEQLAIEKKALKTAIGEHKEAAGIAADAKTRLDLAREAEAATTKAAKVAAKEAKVAAKAAKEAQKQAAIDAAAAKPTTATRAVKSAAEKGDEAAAAQAAYSDAVKAASKTLDGDVWKTLYRTEEKFKEKMVELFMDAGLDKKMATTKAEAHVKSIAKAAEGAPPAKKQTIIASIDDLSEKYKAALAKAASSSESSAWTALGAAESNLKKELRVFYSGSSTDGNLISAKVGAYVKGIRRDVKAASVKAAAIPRVVEPPVVRQKVAAVQPVTKPAATTHKPVKDIDGDGFTKYQEKKGSNEGGFYQSNTNPDEKYYFKFLKSDSHVDNEILASKLYQAVGVDGVPELSKVAKDGKNGLASKIVDGLDKDGAKLAKAGTSLNDAIKLDMAVDAWLANWDTVGEGYDNLLIKDGKSFHIDVGGSLLYRAQGGLKGLDFGDAVNELETFLDPKVNHYSAQVFKGVTKEQLEAGVRKVASISDDEIRALVKAYGPKGDEAKGLADTLIARKQYLMKRFPDALKGGGGVEPKKIKAKAKKVIAEIAPARHEPLRKVDEAFADESISSGFQGKAIPFDKDHIEDQNALVFTEEFNGKQRTVVKMKVRKEANDLIVNSVDKYAVSVAPTPSAPLPQTGMQPVPGDKFSDPILKAVKTINFHNGDFTTVNMTTVNGALGLKDDLLKLAAITKDDDVFKMAQHYLEWIKEIENAKANGYTIPGKYTQFKVDMDAKPLPVKAKVAPVAKKSNDPFQVKVGEIAITRRKTLEGRMFVVDDEAPTADFFPSSSHKVDLSRRNGKQYTIEFDDGIRARYNVWDEDKTWFAQSGDLEIVAPGKPTPELINKIIDKVKQLGVENTLSTGLDSEYMYLNKIAYIRNEDTKATWVNMLEKVKDSTMEEKILAMRKVLSKNIGVDDVAKLEGYNPDGKYQLGFLTKEVEAGQRLQYRPDISKAMLEAEMKNHVLTHSLTDSGNMSTLLESIMANNGAMISTTEKIRLGVPAGGMSPSSDMSTGGASYFFTRIVDLLSGGAGPSIRSNMLVFKKDMLLRADAITYNADMFGRTTGDFVSKNRKSDIAGFKKAARMSSNETIFKQSVTILDNIEAFIAGGHDDVKKCLDVFSRYGVSVLPDGRKIEDVIMTIDQWEEKVRKMKP